MESVPTIIVPAQTLAYLETKIKAFLSHMPEPIRVFEMTQIQTNYQWLLQDEPNINDHDAKCRVYQAWLARRGM